MGKAPHLLRFPSLSPTPLTSSFPPKLGRGNKRASGISGYQKLETMESICKASNFPGQSRPTNQRFPEFAISEKNGFESCVRHLHPCHAVQSIQCRVKLFFRLFSFSFSLRKAKIFLISIDARSVAQTDQFWVMILMFAKRCKYIVILCVWYALLMRGV